MAHGVVCHFDLPHMAQKVADLTRREGRPRADEMAHGAVCRFELPHVAENNRRVTRVDSSLWPQRTVPKLPSGTNGCQTLKTATLNTFYFCQKRPLCQPPPSPTPPPNSHFVRKVKLRLAYRLAFVIFISNIQVFKYTYWFPAWSIKRSSYHQAEIESEVCAPGLGQDTPGGTCLWALQRPSCSLQGWSSAQALA